MKMTNRVVCIGLCLAGAAVAAVAETEKPNIVVVVADDMGWGGSATYGHELIKTLEKTEEMKNILLKLWADIKAEGPGEWWESETQKPAKGGTLSH